MLSDLQRRVREILAGLPEAETFALAGGAALIVTGVVDRLTNDLDYFTPHPQTVGDLSDAVQAALSDAGLTVTVIRSSESYVQLQVSTGDETTNIDLATDYRMMEARITEEGFVLVVDELAADKVLALEARGAPRDYIDFAALCDRFGVAEMCELAGGKDVGFDRARLAERLARFFELPPRVFRLDDSDYEGLRVSIEAALADLEEAISQRE
ncbi:nucleotidyl transferase AbiEii/AbiGii toxin family protein [Candidatus Poriferisocius sp.]|uniref:nucleotidyl transferase AbiEii/AbiGii toxin family protein n=1 Tax=Candidatus Poriferisocius sp. TaxID=3101276 RepID=UPI003B590432